RHALLVARTRERDEPAHGQRRAPLWAHFDRDLQRRAADPAALHLERRLGVVERLLEDGDAGLAGALLDQVHGLVEDALRKALLALVHHVVDELGHRLAVVARIGRDRPLHRLVAPAHLRPPLAGAPAFGFLAPYLDRLCLRSLTPAESRVPRTMW